MNRDIRDPREIGAALEAQRAHSPSMPLTKLADKVLSDNTVRNYDESQESYRQRVTAASLAKTNGQLTMFRA